jgi:hypothetical protein
MYHRKVKQKHRIDIDVKVKRNEWNLKTQQVIMNSKENQDINLILDNIKSKVTHIKTSYRLAERVLTPEL